jgi:hypothetical protein
LQVSIAHASIGLHVGNCSEYSPISQQFLIQKVGEEAQIKWDQESTKCLTVAGQSERDGVMHFYGDVGVMFSKCGRDDPEQLFLLTDF